MKNNFPSNLSLPSLHGTIKSHSAGSLYARQLWSSYMKFIVVLFILFISMGAGAQAETYQPKKGEPVKIGITDQSGSVLGLSFMPPDESGWEITRSGLSVTLKTNGESAGENREIEAYLINLDAPVSPISGYIERIKKNTQEAYAKNQRFKIKAFDVTEDPKNSQCARVYLLLEDTQPTRTGSNQQRAWSEQHMLSCGSLKYKRMGFEVRYYHRYYELNRDDQLLSKANKVLETVVIEDK
jgi:hypothetical protein